MGLEINNHIDELEKNGLTFFSNYFSSAQCSNFKSKAEEIKIRLEKDKNFDFKNDSYHIDNYFIYDDEMLDLVLVSPIDNILKILLNEDYVLTHTNLINRVNLNNKNQTKVSHAGHWHSDSRYLNRKRLSRGFSYILIIMLDPFTISNGATQYVPHSFKHDDFPERYGDYEYKSMTGDPGTMCLFDSSLWHRGGISNDVGSRWSVYSQFGPAFMKPYYMYPKIFSEVFYNKLNTNQKKIFHYNALPKGM